MPQPNFWNVWAERNPSRLCVLPPHFTDEEAEIHWASNEVHKTILDRSEVFINSLSYLALMVMCGYSWVTEKLQLQKASSRDLLSYERVECAWLNKYVEILGRKMFPKVEEEASFKENLQV